MSTSGSATGQRVGARVGEQERRLLEVRRGGCRLGELRRELAEAQVLAAAVDEAEGGGVPERRGAAVAEQHLVAVGQREQLGQAVAQRPHLELDPGLAVRRAQVVAGRGHQERVDRLGPHLGGPAPEASVAREQVGRDRDLGGCVRGSPCNDRGPDEQGARPLATPRHRRPREPPHRSDRRVRDARRRRQGEGAQGGGGAGHRLRGRRARLPDPRPHRGGGGRGSSRPEEPQVHPGRRPPRAEGGDRRQDPAATPASR